MNFDRHIMTIVVLVCLAMLFFGGWMIKSSNKKDAVIVKLKLEKDSLIDELDICTIKNITR